MGSILNIYDDDDDADTVPFQRRPSLQYLTRREKNTKNKVGKHTQEKKKETIGIFYQSSLFSLDLTLLFSLLSNKMKKKNKGRNRHERR